MANARACRGACSASGRVRLDIYTTCFNLPQQGLHHQAQAQILSHSPSASFDTDLNHHTGGPQARAQLPTSSNNTSAASHRRTVSSIVQRSPLLSEERPGGPLPTNSQPSLSKSSSSHNPRTSLSSSSDGTAAESTSSEGGGGPSMRRSSTAASSILTETTATNGPFGTSCGDSSSVRLVRSASSSSALSMTRANSTDLNEAMQKLCVDAMTANQCLVSFTPLDDPSWPALAALADPTNAAICKYNFHVSGDYQHVMSARGNLLRDSPFKRKSIVKVPRSEVLDGKENVKTEMRRRLDEIASVTRAHLAIVGHAANSIGFGLEAERNVEIVITGTFESVEHARVKLLVLLDELGGLHHEMCEIDYKLHNIIAGRRRCVIQQIQEETATNIYFPTSLSGVIGQRVPSLLVKQNVVHITGEFFGVQRARDLLFQISMHKSKCVISRDTAILPRKVDWMLSARLDDLKQIMHDNGTFINFPPIGSQASMISVYGDHRVHIERTIRAIMGLACEFYVASFWLLPITFDAFMAPPALNPAQIQPFLRHIAVVSGAEVVFKSNCFEFHGLESEVRAAVQIVLDSDVVKQFHHEVRFQIELANEHREFISGKKNGKLNKIMKSANVKIKFETFNDYNFLIDIAGHDVSALHGLTMLQEELPAEISFHVPEAYHKRIIGVGGKNIQRIMKKYGVYVKFSNADEFALLGGYADNEDNVIARTPAKNALNLEHLKQAVMELIPPKDKDFCLETVAIPRRYHRTLLGEKSIFIHDIETKTNSTVRFPNKETASDVVSIFGPEAQIHIAAKMILDHVPFEAAEMAALTLSQDFVGLTEHIKRNFNVAIMPWVDRSGASDETIIRFYLNRSNIEVLPAARDLVEEYLVQRKIQLYPGSLRPRPDAFNDSFSFFNSNLLATSRSDAVRDLSSTVDHKLRLAASSPNIKSIFEAPSTTTYGAPGQSPLRNAASFVYRSADQDYPGFYPPTSSLQTNTESAFPTSQSQGQGMPPPPGSNPSSFSSTTSHRGWGALSRTSPFASSNSTFGGPSSAFSGSGFPKSSASRFAQTEGATSSAVPVARHHPSPSDVAPKISHGSSASASGGFGAIASGSGHASARSGLGHQRPRGLAQSFDLGLHGPLRKERGFHQSHEFVDEVESAFSSLDL
ncbi:BZ3500_MvSof-1268-A1-R1_Chr9g10367 [Microbotryum saponariae]|uniref:BZ3500_MvSof-1268-A1-R1_Chr9g10367 protein n=1 Tax=Microbotryum saponariae TaxID=289078 RepID=A0A2X0K9E5_9BASI|nr:BZ3501_MvSof-1269-A2-R1_Chr9g10117 [Microbotryum saponariae]SCZ99977.1 BZ3500_MvSof-1268-A1-R1_Chr9g10367 [Microbotryum saponariae]